MIYIFLICAVVSSASISVFSTLFNRRNTDKKHLSLMYSFVTVFSAFLGWSVIYAFDFSFEPKVLIYSLGYGVFYAMAIFGLLNAFKTGSVALTAFIKQLSLVFVSFWRFIFWNTAVTVNIGIGLVLMATALFLCLFTHEKGEKIEINWKWCIYALMLLAGNAGCSIIQKYQQMAFDKQHGSMLMCFATMFSSVICLLLTVKEEKKDWKAALKSSWFCPVLGGMSSAVLNLFIMLLLASTLSVGITFPVIAVGGMIITILVSVVAYKEKISVRKWIGLAIGTMSIVFLNL